MQISKSMNDSWQQCWIKAQIFKYSKGRFVLQCYTKGNLCHLSHSLTKHLII